MNEFERLVLADLAELKAQMKSLLTLETNVAKEKLRSVLVYGGFPLSAKHVLEGIAAQKETYAVHS